MESILYRISKNVPRPIKAVIHHAAIRHNLEIVRRHARDAKVWAVVKANAYGHGIERVYDALKTADGFAMVDLSEAIRLRQLGWRGPILLLEGVFEVADLELCAQLDIWHVVHSREQITMIASLRPDPEHHVFVKLNSGMNRLGFKPERFREAWADLVSLPQVRHVAMMTHFSDADSDPDLMRRLPVFQGVVAGMPGHRSVANSAALLRFGSDSIVTADWVRAGVALYGGAPNHPVQSANDWGLLPAMSLRTRIIAVQNLQRGDTVGYGSTFVADKPMSIGIAACGYADGYLRSCDSNAPVLVDGAPCRTVGRISMDMLAVDLSQANLAGVSAGHGSEVTLWGMASAAHAGATLPIDTVAAHAGTISYELMCAVASRVPFEIET